MVLLPFRTTGKEKKAMPQTIISDSVPAPHFNLTEREINECLPELEGYLAGFKGSPATRVECQSSRIKYAPTQQIKAGSSIHLTFEVL
jgi:hypothetical protein